MEKSKTNLSVVRRFYDAYNKQDEKILDEVIADDYVDHGHQPQGQGIQGAKSDHREIAGAFQDARFDIDVFALGRGSPTVLGLVLNGRDVVLCAVSSSHAAGRGLLTWLHASEFIGCGWRVQDV